MFTPDYQALRQQYMAMPPGVQKTRLGNALRKMQADAELEYDSATGGDPGDATPQMVEVDATPTVLQAQLPAIMRAPPRPIPEIVKAAPKRSAALKSTSNETRQPEILKGALKVRSGVDQYMTTINEAATKYGVPPELLARMMRQESGGRRDAVSNKGAIGVMQFMPATAKRYNVNVHDPISSIFGGAHYLRDNYDKLGSWAKATAAYNHGENDSAYGLANWQERMPRETRGYIASIRPQDFDATVSPLHEQAQQLGVVPYTPSPAPQWNPNASQPTVAQGPTRVGDAPAPPPIETPDQRAERLRQGLETWKQQQKYAAEQERKNALPPGYGDMGHMKAGMAGLANPGYEDVSGQGQATMMNLMQMLKMGGYNGGR